MNYYNSMMVVLVGTKVVLLLLVVGPWLWGRLCRSGLTVVKRRQERTVQKRRSVIESRMIGRRRDSIAREIQQSIERVQQDSASIDWLKVFRTSFIVLFVAYPGKTIIGRDCIATSVALPPPTTC